MAGHLRAGGDEALAELHEINVTPFMNVILVLLIIFMVAAPLATVDIPVDLPSASATPQPTPAKPIYLTLKADHSLAVGDATVASTELAPALDRASNGDKDTRLYLRADKSVDYGALMELMDRLRSAGYLKIALVGLEVGAPP